MSEAVDVVIDRERVELAASRSSLTGLVDRRLEACGIRDGRAVLLAVSGGVDSTALLAIATAIHRRRRPVRIRPVVAHVDHGIRPDSTDDAIAVRALAEALDLPFRSTRLDWTGTAAVSSSAARDARWNALVRLAAEADAATILAAHHADDQAETILLRLARGTGLDGLAGIPEQRELAPGCRVIRPLLAARRDSIATLVEAAGLPVRHDPTNDRRDRAREMIRHEILPRLESIHPGASGRIAAVATEVAGISSGPGLGPPPWRRAWFRTLDPNGIATLVREVAIRTDADAASTPRSVWDSAVRLLLDEDPSPRTLRITERLDLVLERGDVTLEVDASTSSSSKVE